MDPDAERYYLAYCIRMQLDPEDQESARSFERWWQMVHGDDERTEN